MTYNATQRSVLIIATITSFLGPFLISAVNVALPAIEKDLGLNAIELAWIINAFLLSSAVLLLPAGRIADIWGQEKVYKAGIVVFTISSLMCGFADQAMTLILFRIVQGIGSAMTTTTGVAILVKNFPPNYRGRVLGINVAAVYLGLSAGPFLGGLFTQWWGWQSIFLIVTPMGVLSFLLMQLWLKNTSDKNEGQRMDYIGTLLYALFLIALVYGASHLPSFSSFLLILISIAVCFLFVKYERKKVEPLFDFKLFIENKLFAFSNLAALINYSATFANVFLLSLFLQKIKHLSAYETGAVLIVQPLAQVIFSPIAGFLSDRIESRKLATAGMLLNTVGLFLLALIGAESEMVYIFGLLMLMGVGFGFFSSPNMNTIMGSVKPFQLGLASGTAATMRNMGQMVSMTVTTLLFSVYFGKIPISDVDNPMFVSVMRIAFVFFAIMSMAGIYFSFFRGNLNHKKPM
jgi:EmrB/QacA subfamily drug resistance transporter